MQIQNLPKGMFAAMVAVGITTLKMEFSGGSDEGYLDVRAFNSENKPVHCPVDIEEWAWQAYDYSGAGEGYDYGDIIVYDLVNKTATHEEWCMVVEKQGESIPAHFDIED